jgi:hypothetical protein
MATFPKGHSARTDMRGKPRKTLVVHAGGVSTVKGKVLWLVDASDARTLRGIPAIGPNVGGAIPGTRPDSMQFDDAA